MFKVTVTLTLDLLNSKSIGIIYGSLPFIIPRIVILVEIKLKLMSGQNFANAGQTDILMDGRTERRTTCAII